MKLMSITVLTLAVICLALRYVLNYCFGFYGSYEPFDYAILLYLAGDILLLALSITWIVSLAQKKNRLWTSGMLAGLLVLNGVEYAIPSPSDLIIYGLRDRTIRDFSLNTLRQFAHDFDELPRLLTASPGPAKTYMNEDLPKTDLIEKYYFLTWLKGPGGFKGPSYVAETDGVVDVRWGGVLGGHYGFSVSIDGKRISPIKSNAQILRVSDDIFFVRER